MNQCRYDVPVFEVKVVMGSVYVAWYDGCKHFVSVSALCVRPIDDVQHAL